MYVCILHLSLLYITGIPGVHTTQRNESINSLIKGGNVFATALLDMKMFEAVAYLKDMIDRFLEQELDEITALLQKKRNYCDKVHDHIRTSLTRATNRCLGREGWQIQESNTNSFSVCEAKVDSQIDHIVNFEPHEGVPVSCSCRFFQCMEIPCCGIVAVLKQRGEDPYDPKWLRSQWLLIEHPLAKMAMQRLGASIVDNFGVSDEAMEAEPEHDPSLSQLRERFDKVSAIPYPTAEKVRFATMTNAFNSLRDVYRPYNTPMRYKAVMAAIFDLGASFRGNPSGTWIQEPSSINTDTQAWDACGEKRPAPDNFAKTQIRPSSSSSETCSEYNKKWKNGSCPTIHFLRESKQDWTLYRPAGEGVTWTCPLPGCTKRPIKNNDQSRYAHRLSQGHKELLAKFPTESSVVTAASAAVVVASDPSQPVADAGAGIPDASGAHADNDEPHVVSDSFSEAVFAAAGLHDGMTPIQKAQAVGQAAIQVSHAKRKRVQLPGAAQVVEDGQTQWIQPQPSAGVVSRGRAWLEVNVKLSDRLPRMTAEGLTHFPVNQYCEDCRESELCKTHAPLVSNDNVDFIHKHLNAMKAAGYCLVECGGNGDCFYHSMLFLARIYNQRLYHAWRDHDQFRKQTCDNLLVTCYITMLCLLNFLSILKTYPGSQQFAFIGVRR